MAFCRHVVPARHGTCCHHAVIMPACVYQKLSEYDYTIVYKPGKMNLNADALSRIPSIIKRKAAGPPFSSLRWPNFDHRWSQIDHCDDGIEERPRRLRPYGPGKLENLVEYVLLSRVILDTTGKKASSDKVLGSGKLLILLPIPMEGRSTFPRYGVPK